MNYTKILEENEELIRVIRRFPLVYAKMAVLATFLLLLPFFLMFLLFKWETPGLIIFIILTVIGIIAIVRLIVVYSYNVIIVTNRRIIMYVQKGLFDRRVSEVLRNKIEDITYRYKGFWQTLFKYGTLKVQLKNSESILYIKKIYRPESIRQILTNML